jgi:rhamnopyranosyl-N-acetylglucosaminyl-diphospho-decaprenol beta-1,3/1,4-galactofuranosyltransferase
MPPAPLKIVAVVVSRDRSDELALTVSALNRQQSGAAVSIVIVDSSADPATARSLAGGNVTILASEVNLGGAGGYALGMMSAIAAGAEWIWLMDDDGRPLHDDALDVLLDEAGRRGLDAVSPLVLDAENLERFAFPYPIRGRYVFRRDEVASGSFIPSTAHLFNGLLIRATAIFKIGLPDLRLFIRGDEIDFLHRMTRAGLEFGTTARVRFMHPSSHNELFPVFGGRLHVVYPEPVWKRRNQYRNRAYNFLTHGRYLILAVDFVRYPYFFLGVRRWDFAGLAEWLGCTWHGLRGDVYVEPGVDLTPRPKEMVEYLRKEESSFL